MMKVRTVCHRQLLKALPMHKMFAFSKTKHGLIAALMSTTNRLQVSAKSGGKVKAYRMLKVIKCDLNERASDA